MRYLIAILLGLLAAGCGNKAVDNLMSQASMLIEEHPDSALLALRQIDPSAISPAADARRRLLLAQTYSRTGAEADKDSLTAPALDYYERHGSGAERAYAWYFDAKVHHNAGDLGRAIKGYTQAMLYAERNRDKAGTTKLLMALYHTLGLLYLEQGYDTEAERHSRKPSPRHRRPAVGNWRDTAVTCSRRHSMPTAAMPRPSKHSPRWSGRATRWHSVSSPSRSPCKT